MARSNGTVQIQGHTIILHRDTLNQQPCQLPTSYVFQVIGQTIFERSGSVQQVRRSNQDHNLTLCDFIFFTIWFSVKIRPCV